TRAYVPIYGSGGVGGKGTDGSLLRVIDIAGGEIVGTVDFGKGVRPHCVQVGSKTGRLYVTTELLEAISVIDPVSLKVIGTIPTGRPESHMIAISADEKRGYVVNVGSGTVSILDLEKRELVAVVPVSGECQRIALSTDGRWVFTADQTQPRIAIVDTEQQKVAGWIALPSTGFGTTTSPDGKWLIVTLAHANKLAIVDLAARKVVNTIDLPRSPQESVVRPDGGAVYVSCDSARQVAEIDPHTWTVRRLIQAGPVADGLAWAATR
ncbi:MAG TPA: VCBS domain-containing protein, partial [Opitutaceae bacterium]